MLKEQQAGIPVVELCRKHGISDATFYTWRSKYAGMEVSDARRLKALEDENRKLKKLLAESMLDVATLRESRKKLLTPSSRRMVVTWAIDEKGYSQRRACALIGIAPKTYRYTTSRGDDRRVPRAAAPPCCRTPSVRLSAPAARWRSRSRNSLSSPRELV